MVKKTSKRAQIPPFQVLEFAASAIAREQSGEAIYHLDMGQPGSAAPRGVLDEAHQALEKHKIGYSEAQGRLQLRQRIVTHYRDSYGIKLSEDEVFITTGSSGAFLLSFLCAFDVGDSVALALPGYPCYTHIPNLLGLKTVPLQAEIEHRFQPTVSLLEEAMKTTPIDGLIIASPANPSGYMIPEAQLKELVSFCLANDIRIVSDEIYHGITYSSAEKTICMRDLDDSAIIINSFSKYFCMSGWRLGWMVAPKDLRRAFLTAAQNLYISPPVISQIAAAKAFDCQDELQDKIAIYATNRARLLEELPGLGFGKIIAPDGGFYIYAEIPSGAPDSMEFCQNLLHNCGVSIVPGVDFDAERGHRMVRLSYTDTPDIVEGAITQLKIYKQAGGF